MKKYYFILFIALIYLSNNLCCTELKLSLINQKGKGIYPYFLIISDMAKDSIILQKEIDTESHILLLKDSVLYNFKIIIPNHISISFPLVIGNSKKAYKIQISLIKKYIRSDKIKSVYCYGNFNNFIKKDESFLLHKDQNNKYYLDLKNLNFDTLIYKFLVITEKNVFTVVGNTEDNLFFNTDLNYYNITFNRNSHDKYIKFDPKFFDDTVESYIVKSNSDRIEKSIKKYFDLIKFHNNWRETQNKHFENKTLDKFSFFLKNYLIDIEKKIVNENELYIKKVFFLEYFNLTTVAFLLNKLGFINKSVLAAGFEEIHFNSIFWKYWYHLPGSLIIPAIILKEKKYLEYVDSVIFSCSDTTLQKQFLCDAVEIYGYVNDKKNAKKYYNIILKEYSSLKNDFRIKTVFPLNIQIGKVIPKFSLINVDNQDNYIDNETLKGKYVLLDFWATWCKSCIEDIKLLLEIYNNYKTENFEILSISFDKSLSMINKYRENNGKLPWLNGWIKDNNKLLMKFDITTLPHYILIDPQGKVVCWSENLNSSNNQIANQLKNIYHSNLKK